MPDTIDIAQERKAAIAAEIARLDNFIGMAEALLKQGESDLKPASDIGVLNLTRIAKADPA